MELLVSKFARLPLEDRKVLEESGINLNNVVKVCNALKGSPLQCTATFNEIGLFVTEDANEIIQEKL